MTRARDVADTQDNLGGAVPPFVSGKNKVINGDFGVWQRGTTFTNPANGSYQADRWRQYQDGTVSQVISQQAFAPGTAPVAGYEGTFFIRKVVSSASGNNYNNLEQGIEDVRIFAGQTVTMSFWAKADSSRSVTAYIVQNFGSGGSGAVYSSNIYVNLTTSWSRYTATFALPSIAGKTIGTNSQLVPTLAMPLNTAYTIDFWGVQLEAGPVATPFTTATGTVQGELAACQRYYFRTGGVQFGHLGIIATASSSTTLYGEWQLPVQMRAVPTTLDFSGVGWIVAWGGGVATITNITIFNGAGSVGTTKDYGVLQFTTTGATTGAKYPVISNNSTAAYLGIGAEL
jgi:hypothetical protein